MVDFHTHILPEIDDGSDSLQTSIEMLGIIKEQNIDTIVATPHFSPQTEEISEFLQRRQKAVDAVSPYLDGITLVSGAEVKYCRNISKLNYLKKMAIQDLGYILIEMPYYEWTKQIADDVIAIMDKTGLVPILAHVDRYWNKGTEEYFERFLEAGVLMQINVSVFENFWQRRKFIRLIEEMKIHLIGSDCHNMIKRKPNLKYGFEVLEKHRLTSIIEANEETVLESLLNTSKREIFI